MNSIPLIKLKKPSRLIQVECDDNCDAPPTMLNKSSPSSPQSSASPQSGNQAQSTTTQVPIGFDGLDLLSRSNIIGVLSESMRAHIDEVARATASSLYYDGQNPQAAKRLLCKELVHRRIALRAGDSALGIVRKKLGAGKPGDRERLLLALEKSVAGEHHRFMDVLELYLRVFGKPDISLKISGSTNYIVNQSEATQ